jgi:endonuclease/exonuclease/phosphatase family metal-dependent hydrolase
MKKAPKLWMIFIFLLYYSCSGLAQQYAANTSDRDFLAVCVGFYNVENLFDTINDPKIRDEEFTPDGVNRWNATKYVEKLYNLARVIEVMGVDLTPDGPAVLGLSEVENRTVLEDLARQEQIKGRKYQVVHYDGPDARGVDVAFFYQPKYFRYISSKPYVSKVPGMPDFRTRYQLLMTGELLGERIHFIVAHWPSRSGGERRSRPFRIAAANTAREIIDSIQQAEPGAKIIYMGDLNDNPTDVSIRKHLRAHGDRENIGPSTLFNPFEALYRRGVGSNAWRDSWSLFDQVLVNDGLLGNQVSSWKFFRADVVSKPFMRQPSGRFQGYPFRSYGGGVYLGGFSDHFPTLLYLVREK